jgi:hypothetical protein
LVITPIGFLTKFYRGLLGDWVNNSLGGVLYEIFWILVLFLLFPKRKYLNIIPILVFGITSALEFLQLYRHPILDTIRSTFIGRTLIGTSFVISDFFYYALGCLAGWIILEICYRKICPE